MRRRDATPYGHESGLRRVPEPLLSYPMSALGNIRHTASSSLSDWSLGRVHWDASVAVLCLQVSVHSGMPRDSGVSSAEDDLNPIDMYSSMYSVREFTVFSLSNR